jgi:restriction system protein
LKWVFACPDWEDRIRQGRSLIPDLPLNQREARRAVGISHFVITQRGHELLAQNPTKIDNSVLRQFPEFIAFQTGKSTDNEPFETAISAAVPAQASDGEEPTPEESIDRAAAMLDEELRSQLLDRINETSPHFFEQLVIELIVKMRYGGSKEAVAERLGKSGDEGIDGVVNQDPLGLDIVYIQAKRYGTDNVVGRERIQQFSGALAGKAASKGVFVTTSSFTKGAVDYAKKVQQKIILIDGEELTRLMIRYGVGVRTEREIQIKKTDSDYFESEEEP